MDATEDNQALVPFVHTGTVLTPLRDLQITITIDPAVMRRAADAIENCRRAIAGLAVPVSRLNRHGHGAIIDQEP